MAFMKYDPGYDFSNKGIDWEEYQREVRLRTDAVWERQKLKDYFRLFYKIFYWDPKTEQYYITMPLHKNYNSPDGWRFKAHNGYNPTGKTNSYQRSKAKEFGTRTVSLSYADTLRDKNTVCFFRFRAYKKCEGNTLHPQIMEKPGEQFNPECYQEMLDMVEYCSNVQLNWLSDMWHHMKMNQDKSVFSNNDEMKMMIDEFDNPDVDVKTY
eukprot:CAMPEP_0202945178 /NCGR_PEP_ID=MMETSP1395-20130829/6129_1 /ASSEMBLY_ACC=CAM_ASM_000871 /TAXON_ID=5961 /ORGANISM="Blepharisma japonicum, Strain Stock R1072" /LENGTH=209 /DNA_ID=CAMNT_0049644859 /DNA_START=34 /DNA_END=663 /DNA_ORIENTATION=+